MGNAFLYYGQIYAGFFITLIVTLLYGIFAPWWRSHEGKAFFGLFTSLTLLIGNSLLRIAFGRAEWTLWVGQVLFMLYCVAMLYIGWHVYKAQIGVNFRRKIKG